MKKTFFALLVLTLASSLMAANVVITAVDEGSGVVSIKYTSDVNVSAFALDVNVTGGNITAVNNYHTGESTSSSKGYGIFMGVNGVDINDAGVVQDWGSPIAAATEPCASGTGIGTNRVILGLGALYEDGNQPALSGTLCKVVVDGGSQLCVTEEDTCRGGVVLEDGNGTDANLTNACVSFECFPSDDPDYSNWLKAGSPQCWCNEFQCKGDTDGIFEGKDKDGKRQWVTGADLDVLAAAWQNYDDATWDANPTWICADFNHSYEGKDKDGKRQWVTGGDLDILAAGWQKYDTDSHFTTNPCPCAP